eukprot:s2010_g9.t1
MGWAERLLAHVPHLDTHFGHSGAHAAEPGGRTLTDMLSEILVLRSCLWSKRHVPSLGFSRFSTCGQLLWPLATSATMAQPVTTLPATTAQPAVTYTSVSSAAAAAAQPVTQYIQAGAQYVQTAGSSAVQYVGDGYSALQQGIPQAQSMVVTGYGQIASALDHSKGKWFAPGEALPPGFQITAHPEGHVEPQAHHAMSDAVSSMKGFASATMDSAVKSVKGTKDKKKSKKKKSSGCC